jgi:hypothetical protein
VAQWFAPAGLAAALVLATGCTDPGVIGEVSPCAPGCGADTVCAPELGRCVACLDDEDCVGRSTGSYCQAMACVECRSSADCSGDAGPLCAGGRCSECATDDDCDDEQSCDLGRCVESDDEDHEGEEEAGGNEGEG